ncbi:MAG: hypothetical protein GY822_06120, partial [Deltaproteobacteria bacterium]|nr:hypothetical protein [Deltaproteobacteria bacterium]
MEQIRRRPMDQSSDEDENEEKEHIVPQSTVDDQPQSVSADVAVHVHDDNEPLPVSVVTADAKEKNNMNDDDKKAPSFSMFNAGSTRCGGNDKSNGIVSQCDALERLGAALSVYSSIQSVAARDGVSCGHGVDDEMEPEDEEPTLSDFVATPQRLQFLEDLNHFMASHHDLDSVEKIKSEMVERFGLRQCSATRCPLTIRHFTKRNEVRTASKREDVRCLFYRQKLDSLHFQIFHLLESGYRHRATAKGNGVGDVDDDGESKKDDDDDDEKAIDRELEEAVSAINDSKKKCDFGRFQGDGPNKFTLSVSGIDSACFAVIFAVTLCAHPFSQNVDGSNGG